MAFALPIRIYWEDTDAGGIVYYANYLKFFERARTEWLRSLGIHQQALREATGGIFVVSEATLKYHRPARLDDELLVTANLKEVGRASLTIDQQARLKPKDLAINAGLSAAGPPQGATAFSEGSDAHAVTSVGALLCEGLIRVGWVDGATLRPARMPAHVLEAMT